MSRHLALIAALAAAPAEAARTLPPCPPRPAQLFVAPMGEPFRSAGDAADPVGAWFAQVDRDGDGRITPAEFTADAERFFARLDSDHDGELIPAEVTAYERDVAPEIRLYAAREPGPTRRPTAKERKAAASYGAPLGAGRWSFLNVPEPVAAADLDLNRGVTLAEYRATAAQRFAELDTAKHGYLDRAGLPRTPAEASLAQTLAACDPALPPLAAPPRRPR